MRRRARNECASTDTSQHQRSDRVRGRQWTRACNGAARFAGSYAACRRSGQRHAVVSAALPYANGNADGDARLPELEKHFQQVMSQHWIARSTLTEALALRHLLKCYKRFLFLVKGHPQFAQHLAPPVSIDLIWHAHQSTPRLYEAGTQMCRVRAAAAAHVCDRVQPRAGLPHGSRPVARAEASNAVCDIAGRFSAGNSGVPRRLRRGKCEWVVRAARAI